MAALFVRLVNEVGRMGSQWKYAICFILIFYTVFVYLFVIDGIEKEETFLGMGWMTWLHINSE